MLRDGTVERIASEICWAVASNLGQNTDCHFLKKSIENAVWLCMMDSPHGEQLGNSPALLAERIRLQIDAILEASDFDPSTVERLDADIEQAIRLGLGGDAAPAPGRNLRKRESDQIG